MRTTRTMAGAAVAVMVLGLAACGSDGGSESTTSGGGDLCASAEELRAATNDPSLPLDQARFDEFQQLLANVEEQAPDEIKDDMNVLADGFDRLREIFEEFDFNAEGLSEEQTAELSARADEIASDEFAAAGDAVNDYLSEECGISLES
jgi:hypothetical protein